MKLIQGLMAAISAGMLIYAACVEMLAGDFIMDPTLWKSGIGKQFVAVSSLIVGAGAMAVVGYVISRRLYSFCKTDTLLFQPLELALSASTRGILMIFLEDILST